MRRAVLGRVATSLLGAGALAASTVVGGFAVPAGATGAGSAAAGLALTHVDDLVSDPLHGVVWAAQGGYGDVVAVDAAGTRQPVPDALDGAVDLDLSPDVRMLWAAVQDGDRVVGFDTSTGETTTYATPGCALAVAQVGNDVFFIGGEDGYCGALHLYALDPGTGVVTDEVDDLPDSLSLVAGDGALYTDANLAATPAVVRYDVGSDPTTSAPVLTPTATKRVRGPFVLSPDGARLLAASGAVLDATTLAPGTATSPVYHGEAIALDVAGGGEVAYSGGRGVSVYRGGATYRDLRVSNDDTGPGRVAWLDGRLFYVLKSNGHDRLVSTVVRRASRIRVVTDARRYHEGERAQVTITLDSPDANRAVTLVQSVADGPFTRVASGSVDAHGVLRVAVPVRGDTVLRATYAGSADTDPAQSSTEIKVDPHVRLTLGGRHGSGMTYRVGARALMRVVVTPVDAGNCVKFGVGRRAPSGASDYHHTSCVRPDSRGRAAAVYVTGPADVGLRLTANATYSHGHVYLAGSSGRSFRVRR